MNKWGDVRGGSIEDCYDYIIILKNGFENCLCKTFNADVGGE